MTKEHNNETEMFGQETDALRAEILRLKEEKDGLLAENTILRGDNELLSIKLKKAEKMAMEDSLTGAASREYLLHRLREHFSWLGHHTNEKQRGKRLNGLSVMFFDFDHFKQVNDKNGHEAGDSLLCEIASILRNLVRDEDTVCRWGGDEFAVCFPDLDEESSKNVAERIRVDLNSKLQRYLSNRGIGIEVTPSIGVACYEPGLGVEELISRADQVMYLVKQAGKNGVFAYSEVKDQLINS